MHRALPVLLLPALLAACGTLATTPSGGTTPPPALTSSDPDVQFMASAAQSNLFEIQSSQLAQGRTTTASVLNYANDMISMHTTMQTQLAALASARGVALSDRPGPQQLLIIQRLSGLSGAAFDTEYAKAQLNGHRLTLDFFDAYLGGPGDDAGVKAFAQAGRPMIQAHRDRAKTELPVPTDVAQPLNR